MSFDPALTSQLFLALAGALMGAALGGAASWTNMRRERRIKLTLDLYAQFHDPAFNHLRILAHEALEQGGPLPDAYAAAQGEAKESIATIVHFWERVALLARIGALDERLLKRFFGQYARWWSELLCEKGAALDDSEWGQTLKDVDWLFKRLKRSNREGSRR